MADDAGGDTDRGAATAATNRPANRRPHLTWPRQLSPVEVGQPPVKGQVGFSRPGTLGSVFDMQQVRISVDHHVFALDLGGTRIQLPWERGRRRGARFGRSW